jgi:23S rRNA pseudouridine1911/1915/1917 synthase
VYLGFHHRLDRDTSGVILMTLDQKVNKFIADQFKDHHCEKVYVAVVHGRLKRKQGRVENFLEVTKLKSKQSFVKSVKSGGKKAITDYSVLHESDEFSMVEVRITTGRMHQIRAHFSEMGHPVAGDRLYGSRFWEAPRFYLHAQKLAIKHPITGNIVQVESPVPPEFRALVAGPTGNLAEEIK